MQSLSAVYNSDFNKYLDDLNTKMDYKLPNYYTEQEKNMSFGEKLGTANFLANDALGAVSFLTGAIVSEGIWAAATGGTSLFTAGGRMALKMSAKNALKNLNVLNSAGKQIIRGGLKTSTDDLVKQGIKASNLTKGLQTGRFLFTSAGFEAGVEARHFLKEAGLEWESNFMTQNGRLPTYAEKAEFMDSAKNSSNTLFAANVGLVGASNLSMLGKLFLNRAPSKAISNNIFKKTFLGVGYKKLKDGGIKEISRNKYQKAFGKVYGLGKPMFTEGVMEEGGQSVLSTAAMEYTLSAYDKDNNEESLSIIDALKEGLHHAYGTKEGLTEVGLGALIGILGGGISTGFKFNEVSSEIEQIKDTAKYVNSFTRDNLIENLKFGAKMRKATLDGDKARSEGNLTNEMRADMAAMTAVAERAYHFENMSDTIADFNAALDNIESSALEEQYGLTKEEVEEWKADKKAQFTEVMGTHTRNLQFAEGIVGSTPIAGLDKIKELDKSGVADLKGAIAFTLTMGTKSDEFAEALAGQIKMVLAQDLLSEEDVEAIGVTEALRKIPEEKTRQYKEKSNKLKALQNKLTKLTKAKIEAENLAQLSDKENNKAAKAKINKVQQEILKVQESITRIQEEKTQAFNALNIPQLTDEVVTEDMLDNQEAAVKKLNSSIEALSNRDPQKGDLLKNLVMEYSRAVDNTKRFNELIRGIMDPNIRVNTLSGWLGKIINRKKSVNNDTAQLFINMVNTYQQKYQGRNELIQESVTTTEEASEGTVTQSSTNNNPLSKPAESVSQNKGRPWLTKEEVEGIETELGVTIEQNLRQGEYDIKGASAEAIKEAHVRVLKLQLQKTKGKAFSIKPVIEQLKQKVQDIIKRDPYSSLEYAGEEFNYTEVAPAQEELDRYNELLDKITPGAKIGTILRNPFRKNNPRGLTEAETNELKELNDKLNNWKILTGTVDSNNDSIAELLQLINQLEKEYELTNSKVKVEAKEIPTSEKSEAGISKDVLSTIVTVDVPVAKKLGNTNKYEISHLEPKSLLKLFPNSKLYVIIKGKNVDVNEIPEAKLNELQKTPGTKFILNTETGENLSFNLKERQRLEVDVESLEAQIPNSNLRILDFGNSKFMPLFIRNGDSFIPMEGDFTVESINDNEIISLDASQLYDLEPGTPLRTVVNLNDTFNDKLIKDYKKGKITEEELVNNLHIYISTEGSVNRIVGSVRAILKSSNPNTETFAKLHLLRKHAAKLALESKSPRVELGVTIPLKMVLVGAPNMNVREEEGKVVPENLPLTEEALDSIEDYGYIQDGEVFTNKNLEYSDKEVIFAKSVSKREANKGVKIPVVVFKYKSRTIVFPVSLLEVKGDKTSEAYAILNNAETSDTAKIVEFNEYLLENKINPKNYAIYDLKSEQSLVELQRALEDLKNSPNIVDVNDWLEADHNKSDLLQQIEIAIDITDKPFHAPKGILDFQGLEMPDENAMEISSVNRMDKYAKQVNSIFGKNNPFAEMKDNWKFYDAFEEVGIDKNASNYIMKKKNANILRNAFDQPIPKTVREVLGDELIKEIRSEINQYKLLNQGSKVNTKVIDTELKSEIDNIENNCKNG